MLVVVGFFFPLPPIVQSLVYYKVCSVSEHNYIVENAKYYQKSSD